LIQTRSLAFPADPGVALALVLILALVSAPAPAADPTVRFTDAGLEAGLVAPTWCGREEKPHLLESGGTGLALFDYDGDGDLDLYLVNGWRLDGVEVAERGANVLYRNRGDGSFEDVTERAGVGDAGWGAGVATGDVDGDGNVDLFVSNFGSDVLYWNRGDGTFSSSPEGPGVEGWSTGAVFFDADRDGDLDLYLAAYVDCSLQEVLEAEPELDWEGMKVMFGPFGLEGKGNRFFENLGDRKFEDVTAAVGLEDAGLYYSFSVAAADLDGDLDSDLYVANDSNPNYLYENDGAGRFQEVGLWSGAALDAMGNAQAGMGLALADLDSDGLVDVFVTNFWKDVSTLYRNLGDLVFEDVTTGLGIDRSTYQPLSWGAALFDPDLDGDLDLFVANGHIYPQADLAPKAGTTFKQRNLLLINQGGSQPGSFLDGSAAAGPGLEVAESSRGLAVGDVDGDGDPDLAISNVDAPPSLLRNESTGTGAWLVVDAPQALRVIVEAGELEVERQRVIGGSYVSVNDSRFYFGLGAARSIERLTLIREDGSRTRLGPLPVDRVVFDSRR
jgi:hypothetical protein